MIFQCPNCLVLGEAASCQLDTSRAGIPCHSCGKVAWLSVVGEELAASAPLPKLVPPTTLEAVEKEDASLSGTAPTTADAMSGSPGAHDDFVAEIAPLALRAAFTNLLQSHWESEDHHRKFVQQANAADALASAGKAYRAFLVSNPDDGMAKRGTEMVLSIATAQIMQRGSNQGPRKTSAAMKAAYVFLTVMTVVAFAFGIKQLLVLQAAQ